MLRMKMLYPPSGICDSMDCCFGSTLGTSLGIKISPESLIKLSSGAITVFYRSLEYVVYRGCAARDRLNEVQKQRVEISSFFFLLLLSTAEWGTTVADIESIKIIRQAFERDNGACSQNPISLRFDRAHGGSPRFLLYKLGFSSKSLP